MARGKRTRYFVHKGGFQDGTAYVRYEGDNSFLVVVERAQRELRSDEQRVEAGLWRELTAKQAAVVLKRKHGGTFSVPSASPLASHEPTAPKEPR